MVSPEDELLDASTRYLRSIGCTLLVIGGISVQHQPFERAFNHELVIRFTGSYPKDQTGSEESGVPANRNGGK